MPEGILGHSLELFLLIVALLSGGLSVLRDVLKMYFPPRIEEKRVFWGFVRIAFVIAAAILWFDEREKVSKLISDESRFVGNFNQIVNFNPSPLSKIGIGFIVVASLANKGSPSILDDWQLRIEAPNHIPVTLKPDPFPPSGEVHLLDPNSRVGFDAYRVDNLVEKGIVEPIQRGAALRGVLLFHASDLTARDIQNGRTVFVLTVKDLYGNLTELPLSYRGDNGYMAVPGIKSGQPYPNKEDVK